MNAPIMGTPIPSPDPRPSDDAPQRMRDALARSAIDPEFRSRLLDTPNDALAEMGVEVPASFDLAFVENTVDATHVLPDFVGSDHVELNDDELEAVAGGVFWPGVALAVYAGVKAIGIFTREADAVEADGDGHNHD